MPASSPKTRMHARVFRGTPANLARLARALQRDELVAVPTETVYGLAGNALSPRACEAIFQAKGRPSNDPLIVHIHRLAQLDALAHRNAAVGPLARAFWPGPLTLVLPKKAAVPGIVTSGLPSVAIRMPAHRVFRALLKLCGLPLAAPSANPFGYVSPTSPAHVLDGLGTKIRHILDGGPAAIGLESTILDIRDPRRPAILRPGAISAADIGRVLGARVRLPARKNIAADGAGTAAAAAAGAAGVAAAADTGTAAAAAADTAADDDTAAGAAAAAAAGAAVTAAGAGKPVCNPLGYKPGATGATPPDSIAVDCSRFKSMALGCNPGAAPPASPAAIAPGMLTRHYSPRLPLALHKRLTLAQALALPRDEAALLLRRPRRAAAAGAGAAGAGNIFWLSETGTPGEIARNLFAKLRALDVPSPRRKRLHVALVAGRSALALAINDRLVRAAAKR
jgi:L-threonylcarbamoyladenylate synthase